MKRLGYGKGLRIPVNMDLKVLCLTVFDSKKLPFYVTHLAPLWLCLILPVIFSSRPDPTELTLGFRGRLFTTRLHYRVVQYLEVIRR